MKNKDKKDQPERKDDPMKKPQSGQTGQPYQQPRSQQLPEMPGKTQPPKPRYDEESDEDIDKRRSA